MNRSGMLIGLLVSVGANLFLVGAIAGGLVMGAMRGPPHPPGAGFMLMRGPMMAAENGLSPDRRDAWIAAMRAQARTAGPKMHESRELRREAWTALAADPVDAQAVLASLQRSRDLEQQARADMDGAVVKFAAGLPKDDRQKVAQALARPPHPHGGPGMMWLRDGGPGPGPGPAGGPPSPPGPSHGPGDGPPDLPDR